MEHQDYKNIVFSKNKKEESKKDIEKKVSQKIPDENIKIETDKKLGKIISQGRLAKGFKNQGDFVKELNKKTNMNISLQIYNKWESNKDTPTNLQISKIEKLLGIKLPRNKKINMND